MKAPETSSLPLPEAPYRGLEPYRFCDQAIFFEREIEAERLIRLVTRYRASLLYGESGVGKSSLINAGLIPKALAEGMAVERLRVQPRPDHEFVVERISRSGKENDFLPSVLIRVGEPQRTALSADEFGKRVRDAAGATLLLIFDQFEELLTLAAEGAAVASTLDSQSRILNMIVSLIQDRQKTNLRMLFVFREDYLAKFERFFYFCPELPDRFLRMTPPPVSALRRVLRGPFESDQIPPNHWSRTIPESVAIVLEQQLRPAEEGIGINLSKVQIAALQVWRSSDPVKELAGRGADELVRDYLQDQLNRFREQRGLAESLLSTMITRQGTRKVISEGEVLDELERQDGISAARARAALEKLVTETRLVKRDHHRGTTTYEIVSEFLVPWIRPLKLHREARKARNMWLKRASMLVVLFGALLGAVFYWKYTATTLEARRTELVIAAQAETSEAQKAKNAAEARAQQALDENARLSQKNEELQALLKTQGSDREKKLLDDLNNKAQELSNQQAQNRSLVQQLERSREDAVAAAQALDAEKKARTSDITALQKQLNDLREEGKRGVAAGGPEPGPPAVSKPKETGTAPSAPVTQFGVLALPHDKDVRSAAFSSDGRRILTVSSTAVYVWNAETGASLGKALVHQKDVGSAAFSADGSRIVTVSGNEVRLWNTETGMALSPALVQRKNVYSAALPSNNRIEIATADGIQMLEPDVNLKRTPLLSSNFDFIALAPSGRLAVVFAARSAQLWGLQFPVITESSFKIGTVIPRKALYERAAFSSDGRHVAVVTADKVVQVYEAETGKPERQPITTKYDIRSVALDSTGRLMATMNLFDVQVWEVATGNPIGASIPLGGVINSVVLSPDGRRLVACTGKLARVYVIASN